MKIPDIQRAYGLSYPQAKRIQPLIMKSLKYDLLVEKLKTVQLGDNVRLMKIVDEVENWGL